MNRVRLKPTGVSGAEYINASFLDVSQFRMTHCPIGHQAIYVGVQAEECVHGGPGPCCSYSERLLENGVGVQEQSCSHAVPTGGKWAGMQFFLMALVAVYRECSCQHSSKDVSANCGA